MTFDADQLYALLPAIYRIRDQTVQRGELRALLSVIAEQTQLLEEDLRQLYDDQFIETCAEWVAPYIGDLIGYRTLYGKTAETRSRRAEVANTIAYRRRKDTATMLEQLARDVTGWPARVVEFFQLLATSQYIKNHLRPENHYAPDLRDALRLERINTAFDRVAHTVDVRRISTGQGQHNIPNIGVFIWRLGAFSITRSPAVAVDAVRFRFSPLEHDIPLFTRPEAEDEIAHLADPINVPMRISRRTLDGALEQYYGTGKSVVLEIAAANPNDPPALIPLSDVHACDLSDVKDAGGTVIGWNHIPLQPGLEVAIDPMLGRIAFASAPPRDVLVTFHHGFSAEMGGGEYERAATFLGQGSVQSVAAPDAIQPALDAAQAGGLVEIMDSARYAETLSIDVDAGAQLEFRAGNARRPAIFLGGEMTIEGGDESVVTLNGLLMAGARLRVPDAPGNGLKVLRLRHCTLVPGLSLDENGLPQSPASESLIIEKSGVALHLEHCIVGGLRVADGSEVTILDSIVDATDSTGIAYSGPAGAPTTAGGLLRLERCTVIGKVHTRLLELASNTIFLADLAPGGSWTAPVRADRRQTGCVRFSHVPVGSRMPRRHRCQPAEGIDPLLVRPRFTSLRFGHPAYAQLALRCPEEIRRGADDEAEMGAFHDLFQPQRESDLRTRLDEYLRFGLEAGIFYVT